jgi:hypothetical protein
VGYSLSCRGGVPGVGGRRWLLLPLVQPLLPQLRALMRPVSSRLGLLLCCCPRSYLMLTTAPAGHWIVK